jgi:transcriptional regulator with XRE-family HTH domain
MPIGNRIKAARKKAGLLQKDLASSILKEDGTPISIPYLSDIEQNRHVPAPHILKQLAAHLHLSYDYLLFLAGDLPDDLKGNESYEPEAVEAAFQAFRRTLKDHKAQG